MCGCNLEVNGQATKCWTLKSKQRPNFVLRITIEHCLRLMVSFGSCYCMKGLHLCCVVLIYNVLSGDVCSSTVHTCVQDVVGVASRALLTSPVVGASSARAPPSTTNAPPPQHRTPPFYTSCSFYCGKVHPPRTPWPRAVRTELPLHYHYCVCSSWRIRRQNGPRQSQLSPARRGGLISYGNQLQHLLPLSLTSDPQFFKWDNRSESFDQVKIYCYYWFLNVNAY